MLKHKIAVLFCAVLIGLGSPLLAGNGNGKGNGGGGGGGGGGGDPPAEADPAIVYLNSQRELVVMDADGGNKTVVVEAIAGSEASWSADGTELVFQDDGLTLQTVGVDGTGLTEIYAAPDSHGPHEPTWSPTTAPDGEEKIAFQRLVEDPDGNSSDIWLINPDGTGLQNLTQTTNRVENSATWSSDGTKIAVFFQDLDTDGNGNRIITGRGLMVLHLGEGTTDPIEIVTEEVITSGNATSPLFRDLDWARTADKVLFSRPVDGDLPDLFVIDLDSAVVTQLTFTADLGEFRAAWSPDDSEIVYERVGSKKQAKLNGLHVMNADGSAVSSLDAKDGRIPDWRR